MPITYVQAQRAIQAGHRKAREIGIKVSVAVVDEGGHVVAMGRMDSASWITVDIATAMAYTAAALESPSAGFASWRDAPGWPSVVNLFQGKLLGGQGGLPITKRGKVIGAIGTSGGADEQDRECSQAGIEAISR